MRIGKIFESGSQYLQKLVDQIQKESDNDRTPYLGLVYNLDYSKERDKWLDTNKDAMLDQREKVSGALASAREKGFRVGDKVKGGPLDSKQFGNDFKDSQHQPTFRNEGMHKPLDAGGKIFESGSHHLQELVGQIQKDSDNDRTLWKFQDPCPELTLQVIFRQTGGMQSFGKTPIGKTITLSVEA